MNKQRNSESDVPMAERTEQEERDLREALQRLSKDADGMPSLAIERRMARATLNLLKDSGHLLDGNTVVFYQWRQKCDHHLSRCCAVRIDDISEVRGLFQEFFELGAVHGEDTSPGQGEGARQP